MKLRNLLIGMALLAVAAFAAMPYYTAWQIREAVQQGDAVALARHVDFVAVRTGLKRQLADGLTSQLPEAAKSGAVANWGAMLASRVADAALERVVTPEGVSDLLAGRLPNPFAANAPAESAAGSSAGEAAQVGQARNQAGDQAPAAHAPQPSARYLGWDRFQVSLPAKGQTVQLLLTRKGWVGWQLTHIELPKLW